MKIAMNTIYNCFRCAQQSTTFLENVLKMDTQNIDTQKHMEDIVKWFY